MDEKKSVPFLITLTGPSQSGKTLVLSKLKNIASVLREEGYSFEPQLVKKKTTRDYRIEELKAIDAEIEIDVEHVEKIPVTCDLVYQTYGLRYALDTNEIRKLLSEGKTPYAVINDIRAVEELKEEFPEQVLSIFLFRKVPDLSDFKREAGLRGNVSEAEVMARFDKAEAIYRMYIENIALFDKVLLNAIEYNQEDLHDIHKNIIDTQLINIIKGVFDGKVKLRKNSASLHSQIPKTFILAGNAASGKDELIRAVKDLGKLQAEIIPKFTVRRQEEDDEDEMICRFRPKAEIVAALKQQCGADRDKVLEELDKVSYDIRDRFIKEWEEMKKAVLLKIPDWEKLFWSRVNSKESEEQLFEDNPDYVDLDKVKKCGKILCRESDDTVLVEYENQKYVIYHAKGNEKKLYGCKVDSDYKINGKYKVLVASQYGVFNIFKNQLGADNVAVIYSHSQISEDEFVSSTKDEAVKAKRAKFNEYLNDYVENIVYYDHVVIYAKAHLTNEQSLKEEELIDQMFRLFRAY